MGNIREQFEPNIVFHVYNHGNAGNIIFKEDKNYTFFLRNIKSIFLKLLIPVLTASCPIIFILW